jgi:pyruvate dehydrogenase E1 component
MATRRADLSSNRDPELQEWLESMESLLSLEGPDRAKAIFRAVRDYLADENVILDDATLNTPYRNSIPVAEQPAYPGNIELEQRIENILRWNAMAMVLRGYDSGTGVGGHIGTYASAATMMEIGLNHFFRNKGSDYGGDLVSMQAHAAPGIYARAFLEGRLSHEQLENFRRELQPAGGLSSYPHPRNMPDFWQMPCASMGLSTPSAIYQARFIKYLENRGLKPPNGGKVWAFIGDGESDEPEVLGTINIAARERLDNLIMVVNCNLQRLDGPVRGNGKIIQELERSFRGAGWQVIKVIWSGEWDPLFAIDDEGVLQERMNQAVDGDYQMYSVSSGPEVRSHWVGDNQKLTEIMQILSDEEIRAIRRGGHDHRKVNAAFARAAATQDRPTVILIKTIKGFGMQGYEGSNAVHQKKNLSPEERIDTAKRLGIPLDDAAAERADFYKPAQDSEELKYLRAQRESLGGPWPQRVVDCPTLAAPDLDVFADQLKSSGDRELSTTMAFVRMLAKLLDHPELGKYIVPIVPDEARTFGMAHLWHGGPVPQGRHLFIGRPEISPRGQQDPDALSRGDGWPDPAGGHLRSRGHGLLHGCRYRLCRAWRAHHPLLHLLFNFRFPACGRHDLELRRHALPGLPAGWHFRPNDPKRRRPAARRRSLTGTGQHRPESAQLRPVLCLRTGGDRARGYSPHVPGTGKDFLLRDDSQSEQRDARHARRS